MKIVIYCVVYQSKTIQNNLKDIMNQNSVKSNKSDNNDFNNHNKQVDLHVCFNLRDGKLNGVEYPIPWDALVIVGNNGNSTYYPDYSCLRKTNKSF